MNSLSKLSVPDICKLPKEQFFNDLPDDGVKPEDFPTLFGRTSEKLFESALKGGLIVWLDKGRLINVKPTYLLMRKYFLEKEKNDPKPEEDDKDTVTDIVLVDDYDDDEIKVGTEQQYLKDKWKEITGQDIEIDDKNLPQHFKKFVWKIRYLKVAEMILSGENYAAIRIYMENNWGCKKSRTSRIINAVQSMMIGSVEKNFNFFVSKSYLRLESLYNMAVKEKDYKAATVINKEIVTLFGVDKLAQNFLDQKGNDGGQESHLSLIEKLEAEDG